MELITKREPPKITKNLVLTLVGTVPFGKVVTYGMVANELGYIARTVGWIMASLSEEEMVSIPWHRVIGAGGTLPALKFGFRGEEQIRRLEEEGFAWGKSKLLVEKNQWYEFPNQNHG
jgi:methylated-DNA-protein-cysteine methyltransferase related protein